MAKTIQGSVAVIRTWGPPFPQGLMRRLELHLSVGLEIIAGDPRRFTNFYPDGVAVRFPMDRIEVLCEVLPSGFSEDEALRGKLPGGAVGREGLRVVTLSGVRAAMKAQRVPVIEGTALRGRVLVIDRRRLGQQMPEQLRYIGIGQDGVQAAMTQLRELIASV
jgi:hypothetical protein